MGYLCPGGKVWARMSLQTDQNNCLHSQIWSKNIDGKVHIFWEGHKILRNLHLTFVYMYYRQKKGEDFAKFCGLLWIYELYVPVSFSAEK